jgi:hypothetical protein
MRSSRQDVLLQERLWATPVAAAALLAAAALVVSGIVGSAVHGDGEAELLRSVQAHGSDVTTSAVIDAIAFVLLVFPLAYLFRVVKARAERMWLPMIGLVVLAPICLAISTGLGVVAKKEAASQFTSGEAKSTLSKQEAGKECTAQLDDMGAKSFRDEFAPKRGETSLSACKREEVEDDDAANALSEASPTGIATFFGIVGGLSLIIGLFYTSLWAMRTGVLGRFWAALGMALGVTVLLGIVLFLLLWLVYVGLLIGGWVPGGRPPAWEAGEAVPWPSPGEKVAEDLEPKAETENPSQLEEPEDSTGAGQSR